MKAVMSMLVLKVNAAQIHAKACRVKMEEHAWYLMQRCLTANARLATEVRLPYISIWLLVGCGGCFFYTSFLKKIFL